MERQQANQQQQPTIQQPMRIQPMIGRSISRSLSLRVLNDMTEDRAVLDAIEAIPRCQRNRRIRKFISLASKRGVSASVLSDFVATIK
jgi:hypothetical protein